VARPLTGKQRAFVDAYVGQANMNATRAAVLAGYSARTARQAGAECLSKPVIRAEIARREAVRERTTDLSNEALDGFLIAIINDYSRSVRDRLAAIRELNRVRGRYSAAARKRGPTLEEILSDSRE
jgi:phage terminase small subunit